MTTCLKNARFREIRDVMAHEMGHYVLNHVMKFFAFAAAPHTPGFRPGVNSPLTWAVRKWGDYWRVRDISDPAGLPLLVLIFAILSFLGTPINNALLCVRRSAKPMLLP